MTTKSLLLTEFGGSVSADVDAPADDVFALLTDTSRLPEWNARIRRVLEPAPPPLAPGVEWVVQMQVAGARWPSRSTAVTCDPGLRVFEHTSRSDDGNPARALWPGLRRRPPSAGRTVPPPAAVEVHEILACGRVKVLVADPARDRDGDVDLPQVNTHSFQAPGFNARFGYRECGRTPGYPHGHYDIHLLRLLR